jgi:hypothetical protein
VHLGHQTIGVLPATPIHPLVDRVSLQRLASHAQHMPWPCATQESVGQVLEMLPALSLALRPPTGGEQMQRGMVLAMAAMRVEHRDGALSERLALDGAREIIQALRPAAHERAQYDRRVLGAGRAEHRRDRQDDGARDHPRVEDLAHLADPVIHLDLRAAQAQGGLTAHRHEMLALTTGETALCARPHLVWMATRQHLGHQIMRVGRLIARMGVGESIPVVGKELLEDVPVPCGCCQHEGPPSAESDTVAIPLWSHSSSALSIPPRCAREPPHPPH